MKNIKIIKNRSDIGAGTRGADMGVDAMEVAAINKGIDFFNDTPFVDLETDNETIYTKVKSSNAKRVRFVVEQCRRVADKVVETINNNEFPLVISGDHSSALGTISGVKAANPDARLGVIWIDAHGDLHSPYTSPSGNVHGMPLAAVLQEDNIDRQINEPHEETIAHWESLKKIGTDGPKILPEDLIFFGVRDTEEPEDYIIDKLNIKNYTVAEVRFRGLQNCVAEAIEKLSDCDAIYITFDVDSMDCDLVSYGTGTPVPFGFSPEESINLIKGFLATDKVACLEFTEVNPLLDNKGNVMAETAVDVLMAVIGD